MKGKLVSYRKINILYFIRYVDNFYELCSKIFKGNIKRKDIIENEMKVFGNLNFSLYFTFKSPIIGYDQNGCLPKLPLFILHSHVAGT